jgi:hypothetical protein
LNYIFHLSSFSNAFLLALMSYNQDYPSYQWSGRSDLNRRPLAPKASALNQTAPRPA